MAPIEVQVDTANVRDLETRLREAERAASDLTVETQAMAVAAGRTEADFRRLAQALDISEDEARRLTGEVLQARSAAIKLESAARDIANQLGLSEDEARRLTRSLREADRAAEGIETRSSTLVTTFGSLRGIVAGVGSALAVVGGTQILGAAVRGAQAALTQFQLLNESVNAVEVTFGSASETILRFGQDAAQAAGLSAAAFQQAVVPIGSVLRNFGFDADQAADASITLVQRAADLASVFNTDVSEALTAINAALVGQVEPLRRYGAEISQARVAQEALALGLIQTVGELDTQSAVAARVSLILRDTSRVQGDFANTSDQLANAQRIAAAETQNFGAEVGENLAPALAALVGVLPEVLDGVRQLIPAFASGADSAAEFFASLGEGDEIGFRTLVAGGRGVVGTLGDVAGAARDVGAAVTDAFVGDLQGAGEALEVFETRVNRTGLRSVGVQLAAALDQGADASEAFRGAVLGLGRAFSSANFDLFRQGFRDFAIQAGLTQPQLLAVTRSMVEQGEAAGLSSEEIGFLIGQLAALQNVLFETNQEVTQAERAMGQDLPAAIVPTTRFLDDLRVAAAEAGVSLTDIATGATPAAVALRDTLTPAQETAVAFEALRTEGVEAAEALALAVVPAVADVSRALEDLNNDGRVTATEFAANLRDMLAAQLEFTAAIATIAGFDPQAAAQLATLPIEQALDAIREIAADPSRREEILEALFPSSDQVADHILDVFTGAAPALLSPNPAVAAAAKASILASIRDPGLRAAVGASLDAVLDPALAASFADLEIPDIGPQIEEAFSEPEAARGGARITVDAFRRELINDLAAERFGIQSDIQTEIDAYFAGVDIGTDFGDDGAESAATFIDGFIEELNQNVARLKTAVVATLDSAIERSSPPQVFLDAGLDSGEAFWMGFEQANTAQLNVRVPNAEFGSSTVAPSGPISSSTFTFAPTVVAPTTPDLETTLAEQGQLFGAISGLLSRR